MRFAIKQKIGAITVCLLFVTAFLFAETPPKDFHFQNGVKLYLEGDNAAALVALRKSLEINPDSREILELISQISGEKKTGGVVAAVKEKEPALPGKSLESKEAAQLAVPVKEEVPEPVFSNRLVEPEEAPPQTVLAKKEVPEPAFPAGFSEPGFFGGSLELAPPVGSFVYASPRKIAREYPNHLEAEFSFEYLDPEATYGDWKNFGVAFSRDQSDSLSYSLRTGVFWRDEGSGMNFGAGVSRSWNKYLYTSSSISAGTDVSYLSELSLSHGFNFKVGKKRNNIIPVDFTYIRSRSGHEDYVVSSGITAYRTGWVYGYKISRNQNEPGSVISYSHLGSIAHGKDGSQWIYLTLSTGQEAYLATYLSTPQEVNQDSYGGSIRLKRWLGKNHGFLGELSYFTLGTSYDRYGLSFGMFTDF